MRTFTFKRNFALPLVSLTAIFAMIMFTTSVAFDNEEHNAVQKKTSV